MISCASIEQGASEPPRRWCPVEDSLTVFAVGGIGARLLVGEPADSDAYVLIPLHSPPMQAAVKHVGQVPAHTNWFAFGNDINNPSDEERGVEFGIALGPYTGPPDELSITCHSGWCRGKWSFGSLNRWDHSITIHMRGRPWLYIYETADYSGVRTTELRTAPPCEPTVIASRKHYRGLTIE